ncbi:MAG: hypothetical protein U9Q37_10665 [Euryarchaeota archaeon]|nr:hypothetical protein [Euryarchaeota archaeon]
MFFTNYNVPDESGIGYVEVWLNITDAKGDNPMFGVATSQMEIKVDPAKGEVVDYGSYADTRTTMGCSALVIQAFQWCMDGSAKQHSPIKRGYGYRGISPLSRRHHLHYMVQIHERSRITEYAPRRGVNISTQSTKEVKRNK